MLSKLLRRTPKKLYPYSLAKSLLSPGEMAFYRVLRQVVPKDILISVKTRLADVLICPDSKWETHGWRVSSKHLDFVLLDAKTLEPLMAIELDDKTHKKRDRKQRDEFVDDAAAEVDFPILHVKAMAHYDARQLRKELGRVLG